MVVLVVLAFGVDRVALAVAAGRLRDRVQQRVPSGTVRASISSFPFLGRLLLTGYISKVRVNVERPVAGPLTFSSVAADLRGVTVDKSQLLRDRQVRLTGIESGTVSGEISQEQVSRAVHADVQFHSGGKAVVSFRGLVRVEATVRVSGGVLTLQAGRLPTLSLPIPKAPLLPCQTSTVEVLEGRVRASCTIQRLPAEVAAARLPLHPPMEATSQQAPMRLGA